ncbi:transposase [Neolewinella aurantiaca]|nr:transposase [Neolewinella aurantiaca]
MKKSPAKLPHQPLDHRPVHVTYRLAGSLPKAALKTISARHEACKAELEIKAKTHPGILQSGVYASELFSLNARYELDIDEALHTIASGPFYLQDSDLAHEIIDSWLFLQKESAVYVYAVCVMGNHVHALIRAPDGLDTVDIGALMNRHKAHTARVCNKLIGKTGTQFWEHFYFDRTVHRGKFERVMWYVLNNPVKSRLVEDWQDWAGTYLNPDFEALFC